MTPNQITLIRIFLVPFMIFFYLADFIPYGKLIAVIIFAVAAITDFIDGRLARKTGQVTDLGKFLDPIADKLLVLSALVLVITNIMVITRWPIWATIIAIIILAREFMVTALRQIAASKNVIMSADIWGKYKALMQDLALLAFMLLTLFNQYPILSNEGFSAFTYICFVLIITATLLTIISGINYFIKNKSVFAKVEPKTIETVNKKAEPKMPEIVNKKTEVKTIATANKKAKSEKIANKKADSKTTEKTNKKAKTQTTAVEVKKNEKSQKSKITNQTKKTKATKKL